MKGFTLSVLSFFKRGVQGNLGQWQKFFEHPNLRNVNWQKWENFTRMMDARESAISIASALSSWVKLGQAASLIQRHGGCIGASRMRQGRPQISPAGSRIKDELILEVASGNAGPSSRANLYTKRVWVIFECKWTGGVKFQTLRPLATNRV